MDLKYANFRTIKHLIKVDYFMKIRPQQDSQLGCFGCNFAEIFAIFSHDCGLGRTLYVQSFRGKCVYKKYWSKIVSEYDQEIPQSQTADYPVALRGRAAQPSRDTRKTN